MLEPSSDVISHGRKELKEPRGTHFVQTKLFTLRDLLRFTIAEVKAVVDKSQQSYNRAVQKLLHCGVLTPPHRNK